VSRFSQSKFVRKTRRQPTLSPRQSVVSSDPVTSPVRVRSRRANGPKVCRNQFSFRFGLCISRRRDLAIIFFARTPLLDVSPRPFAVLCLSKTVYAQTKRKTMVRRRLSMFFKKKTNNTLSGVTYITIKIRTENSRAFRRQPTLSSRQSVGLSVSSVLLTSPVRYGLVARTVRYGRPSENSPKSILVLVQIM